MLVASAGGHPAIHTLLMALPADFPVPLLVMQPLGADNHTVALEQRGLPFAVAWVNATAALARGTVLVCPPQTFVELLPDGTFRLAPNERGALDKPLDHLLASVARSCGPRAIGIVLTGQGSDGAFGARQLHLAGGRVVVQSEATAAFPELPRAVVQAGAADRVAPLQDLGQVIGELVASTPRPQPRAELETLRCAEDAARPVAAPASAAAALHGSEEKYRTLFEAIDAGFALMELVRNPQGQVIDLIYREVNQAQKRITGYPDAVGKSVWATTPHFNAARLNIYQQVSDTGEMVLSEDYIAPLDRWLRTRVLRVGEAGSPYCAAVFEDITERKKAEIALRASEARTAFLLQLSDALRPLSDAGEMKAAANRLLGEHLRTDRTYYVELDRARGLAILERDYVRGDEPSLAGAHPIAAFEATLASHRAGQSFVCADAQREPRIRDADRPAYLERRLRSFITTPLIKDGEFIGAMAVTNSTPRTWQPAEVALVQDVAERTWDAVQRARTEAALRQLNATLEQRVEERTQALQRSNQELDQFAALASHDLKAPLRAIRQLAQWIEEDAAASLPPAAKGHLDKLQGRVRRMGQLIDDLLAYSRAGRHVQPPEGVDSEKLVNDIWFFLPVPPGFQLEIRHPLPHLYTERVPLETVLRNLLGNALKHHPHPAQGRVQVAAHSQGEWVEFSVSDNGPGIAPQYHERIFEVFQSLQPHEAVEGSGMGLAIVKKAVEMRGGRIYVESVPGQGATFRFTWPQGKAGETGT